LDALNKQILLAIKGKQTAYKFLLDAYWDDVYRFQKSRINNQNDAEDITIKTFAKAFDNLKQFDVKYNFKNWLFMMSRQIYIDFQRKKKQNIVSIKDSSEAFQLTDKELLAEYAEGLIALSSCGRGEIAHNINKENIPRAIKMAGQYRDIMGQDNFFLHHFPTGRYMDHHFHLKQILQHSLEHHQNIAHCGSLKPVQFLKVLVYLLDH